MYAISYRFFLGEVQGQRMFLNGSAHSLNNYSIGTSLFISSLGGYVEVVYTCKTRRTPDTFKDSV